MPSHMMYPTLLGEICLECLDNRREYSLKADINLREMARNYWIYKHPILDEKRNKMKKYEQEIKEYLKNVRDKTSIISEEIAEHIIELCKGKRGKK